MVESGLGGRFWFKSAVTGCEARNVTYKAQIGTTPWKLMHGEKKDVSRFRAFGCRAWVHINSERREKGKYTPRAMEATLDLSPIPVRIHSSFRPGIQ